MKGEFSRLTFDPRRHFTATLWQQGRVGSDADWNEWVEQVLYRFRTETIDVIGECGRPKGDPGFTVSVKNPATPSPSIQLSAGRLYAGGMLAELQSAIDFAAQTDWPIPSSGNWSKTPPAGNPYPGLDFSTLKQRDTQKDLFYVEVWMRNVTALIDEAERAETIKDARPNPPDWNTIPEVGDYIREHALGGPDTCTRLQTVAQVKRWPVADPTVTTCEAACRAFSKEDKFATQAAMQVNVQPTPPVTKPCDEPLTGGYGGVENRTYRVEVHNPGQAGLATFKWSLENGAFLVPVINLDAYTVIPAGTSVNVQTIGNDQITRLKTNDWVELCGEETELGMWRNPLTQLGADPTALPDGTWQLKLKGPVTLLVPHAPFLRRWSDDTKTITLNTPFGLDPGSGLTVTFYSDAQGGTNPAASYFRETDYWIWAARTRTRDIEPPDLMNTPQAPRGIERHRCCLALVTWRKNSDGNVTGTVNDCPNEFPPLTGLPPAGCECTACVTAESHNNGTFTIQMAIDKVKKTGGKVCLGPGYYVVQDTILVSGAPSVLEQSLHIAGVGPKSTFLLVTSAVTSANKPGMLIQRGGIFLSRVTVEDLTILNSAPEGAPGKVSPIVSVEDSVVTIQRCGLIQMPSRTLDPESPAIALRGSLGDGVIIRGNFLEANVGIRHLATQERALLLTGDLYIQDNLIPSKGPKGISLEGKCIYRGTVRISKNAVGYCTEAGITIAGQVVPDVGRSRSQSVEISGNKLSTSGDAIVCSVNAARITANSMGGDGAKLANGIVLAPPDPTAGPLEGCQILENRINDYLGTGILINAHLGSAMIKQNIIQATGRGGIVMGAGSRAEHLSVENNQLLGLAPAAFVDQTGFVTGITLRSVADATVQGNVVKDVGTDSHATVGWGGIVLYACTSARISGNYIVNIGPPQTSAESAGIAIFPPYDKGMVAENEIRRSLVNPPQKLVGKWWAVYIGSAFQGASKASGFETIRTAEGRMIVVSEGRILDAGQDSQVTEVRGNLTEAFGIASTLEITATGSCIVVDNHCVLVSGAKGEIIPPVAQISAPYAIASGNFLEAKRQANADGLWVLNAKNFTILGNIASRGINVNLSPIADPWKSLNSFI